MEELIKSWLINSPPTILIAYFLIKTYGQKTIEHKFNKLLKEHEHELALITEKAKFNYSRMNQDFNLWTIKRHEAYAKLYSAIALAVSGVLQMRGITIGGDDYNQYEKWHVEEWMKTRGFHENDIKELLNNWENDKKSVLERFKRTAYNYRNNLAFNQCNDANNILVESRIYISDELSEMTNTLTKNLSMLYFSCIFSPLHWDDEKANKEKELHKDIEDMWTKLAPMIRKELSGGYDPN